MPFTSVMAPTLGVYRYDGRGVGDQRKEVNRMSGCGDRHTPAVGLPNGEPRSAVTR